MGSVQILIVDDNASVRRVTRRVMEQHGLNVLEAVDGRTALAIVDRFRPDLVLLDLVLPDTDGFRLLQELRRRPATAKTPILAFSGFISEAEHARVSAVGFDDVVTKPVETSRLLSIIDSHVRKRTLPEYPFGVGRRVVLVDDNPLQLKLTRFRLARMGFAIDAADDGHAALDLVREVRPDLIVADVLMPGLDGFELTMAIQGDEELAAIPVILLTSSFVEEQDRLLARRAGAIDLVVRTPDLKELIDCLRGTIGGELSAGPTDPDGLVRFEQEHMRSLVRQLERQVLTNGSLVQRISAQSAELAVLATTSTALLAHQDIEIALIEALSSCLDAIRINVGALYLVEPDESLRVRVIGEESPEWIAAAADFFGQEAMLRKIMRGAMTVAIPSVVVPGTTAKEVLSASRARSMLVVPLNDRGRALGAILMVSREFEAEVRDSQAFAQGIGIQITQAVALSRAFHEMNVVVDRAKVNSRALALLLDETGGFIVLTDRVGCVTAEHYPTSHSADRSLIGCMWTDAVAKRDRQTATESLQTAVSSKARAAVAVRGDARFTDPDAAFDVSLEPIVEDEATANILVRWTPVREHRGAGTAQNRKAEDPVA